MHVFAIVVVLSSASNEFDASSSQHSNLMKGASQTVDS